VIGPLEINDQWDHMVASIQEDLAGLSLPSWCPAAHCLQTARWSSCLNFNTDRKQVWV